MKNELKIDSYPNKWHVYRIRKTDNIKARKVFMILTMLYKFRIKNKKDYYEYDNDDIKKHLIIAWKVLSVWRIGINYYNLTKK